MHISLTHILKNYKQQFSSYSTKHPICFSFFYVNLIKIPKQFMNFPSYPSPTPETEAHLL